MLVKLTDIASVIRSKNAGPYELTLDVILKDDNSFQLLKKANAINAGLISRLYNTTEEKVISIVYFVSAK